jgi:trehalose 6-phosphate phosphatase
VTGTLAGPLGEAFPRLGGSPLVLLLDVDGTLAPIVSRPEDAAVPEETRRTLSALASRPDVRLIIVSGRAAADARRLAGAPGAWTIGNHGIETIAPDGSLAIDEHAAEFQPKIAAAARRLRQQLGGVPGVLIEDKTWTLSVHYRLADPAAEPRVREAVESAADAAGLRVLGGKMVVELRPPIDVHKGTAALALVRRLVPDSEAAAILCAGDDRTDEDMFVAMRAAFPQAVTVRVAGGSDEAHRVTAAEVVVPDVEALRGILEALLAAR